MDDVISTNRDVTDRATISVNLAISTPAAIAFLQKQKVVLTVSAVASAVTKERDFNVAAAYSLLVENTKVAKSVKSEAVSTAILVEVAKDENLRLHAYLAADEEKSATKEVSVLNSADELEVSMTAAMHLHAVSLLVLANSIKEPRRADEANDIDLAIDAVVVIFNKNPVVSTVVTGTRILTKPARS